MYVHNKLSFTEDFLKTSNLLGVGISRNDIC